jgi:YebC/PmpR family DNA-binding regulatory protein
MAGHSQFKNIMYRKGVQDAKRAKMFAKIAREIMVSVRSGLPDANFNSRLRSALTAARAANMPKDNIDRAIKKALGGDDGVHYEEVRYEGYGPGGTALIVEGLTDNRNRTASDVRSAFTKFGGNLAETGSVSFMFNHCGWLVYSSTIAAYDTVFESVLDAGADDVEQGEHGYEITCSLDAFGTVRDFLAKKYGEPQEARILWRPINVASCNESDASTFLKLIDLLEDNDDVQNVYSNGDVSEDILAKLSL